MFNCAAGPKEEVPIHLSKPVVYFCTALTSRIAWIKRQLLHVRTLKVSSRSFSGQCVQSNPFGELFCVLVTPPILELSGVHACARIFYKYTFKIWVTEPKRKQENNMLGKLAHVHTIRILSTTNNCHILSSPHRREQTNKQTNERTDKQTNNLSITDCS